MAPETIIALLEQLLENRIEPTSVDFLFLQLISDPNDKQTRRMLAENHQLVEVRHMLQQAMEDKGSAGASSTVVLLSFRALVAAEESSDRDAALKSARSLVSQIDQAKYPLTCAFAYLKIGTALAAESRMDGSKKLILLREAAENLLQALRFFGERESPDLRCLSHYNLALAYKALWEGNSDWDEGEDDSKQAALQHGIKAIDLMEKGVKAGSRLALTKLLISLIMSGGEKAQSDKNNREFVVKLVKGFLGSSDAKNTPSEERDNLRRIVAIVKKGR